MNILVTGTNRGLGKYISSNYQGCDTFTRENTMNEFIDKKYDLIIHCAASVSHYDWNNVTSKFFDDNIKLTSELVKINHSKFVYVSSMDQSKDSPYGISKRISESIVRDQCSNHLIIRPSGLLGKEMKENTFQKILKNKPIALTSDSVMNYIIYKDVLEVINNNLSGTVAVSANGDVTMGEIVKLLDKNIEFGEIYYNMEISDNDFSLRKGFNLNKTSEDNILEFVRSVNEE